MAVNRARGGAAGKNAMPVTTGFRSKDMVNFRGHQRLPGRRAVSEQAGFPLTLAGVFGVTAACREDDIAGR